MLSNFNPIWFKIFNTLFYRIHYSLRNIDVSILILLRNLFMGYAVRILVKYDELVEDNELNTLSPEDLKIQQTLKSEWKKNLPMLADEKFTCKKFSDTIFNLIIENDLYKNRYLDIFQDNDYDIDPYNIQVRNDMSLAVKEILKSDIYSLECSRYGDSDVEQSDHFISNDDYLVSKEELENEALRQEHIRQAKEIAEQIAEVVRKKKMNKAGHFGEASGGHRRRHKIKKTKKRISTRRRRSSKARNSRKARKSSKSRRR